MHCCDIAIRIHCSSCAHRAGSIVNPRCWVQNPCKNHKCEMSNEIWEMAGRGKALREHAIGNAWIFPSEGARGPSDGESLPCRGGPKPGYTMWVIPAHGCRSCRERDAASSRHGRTRHATRARHNRQTHVRAHTTHTHTGPVALSGGTELAIIMLAVCTRILHRRDARCASSARQQR